MTKEKAAIIMDRLSKVYPDAKPELRFGSVFELLIAVILSAQCTDKRVNIVTAELFKEYNAPEKILELSQEELEEKIRTCGLYKSKAKHILAACRDIVETYGGKVPETTEELMKLSGVGRKTANVVTSVAFDNEVIAVDTHVFRLSNRIGLTKSKTPLDTEKQLNETLEKSILPRAHHYLIFHGRRCCKAINPDCENCAIFDLCEKNGVENNKKRLKNVR